jgi:formylglycine-generating enzyme required for sulfatase activity
MKPTPNTFFLILISILFISYSPAYSQSAKRIEKTPRGMMFVPQGSFKMNVIENNDTLKVTVSVDAFWMSNEVTNFEYREYVSYANQHLNDKVCWVDLEKTGLNIPNTNKSRASYVKCVEYSEILGDIIDSAKWPYNDYFYNTKYDNYPVVGVSQRQATFYCHWKTLIENSDLEKSGKPAVHDYRLPLEEEWAYVASQPQVKKVKSIDKNVINPTVSGNPNDWGLYNMTGNVSEWTASYQHSKLSKTDTIKVNKELKIVRGGSWRTTNNIEERKILDQNMKEDDIGFRIVRSYLGNKK